MDDVRNGGETAMRCARVRAKSNPHYRIGHVLAGPTARDLRNQRPAGH